jgi:predicted nucleic acid-binding protein
VMVSFDTNVLVYATASISEVKVMRARDLIARAMRAASSVLLLQTLAEFSNVAIRKARTSAGQLMLGAPCCRHKQPTKVIFRRHSRL